MSPCTKPIGGGPTSTTVLRAAEFHFSWLLPGNQEQETGIELVLSIASELMVETPRPDPLIHLVARTRCSTNRYVERSTQ
jgi:hypothetical protein